MKVKHRDKFSSHWTDSKALTADTRQALWESFETNTELCYSSATLSPQAISAGMLRRAPINLNQQAQDATMGLVRDALDRGLNIREVSGAWGGVSMRTRGWGAAM